MKNKDKATVLITILGFIATLFIFIKFNNPHFTIGGPKFRTPFWSSMFFMVISIFSFTSVYLLNCKETE